MAGPTPITALIHSATMVTAGVFMVARLAPLYNLSPTAMGVVAVTGGVTAIFAATIALTQNDIKRVVAYSTVSQLGYMMMACGLGAYTAGMYHLLTHGAFKALLFLACGSVIIALHHEQDIRRMGGLKDKLPITYWTFVIGSLALAGFPLTAGFFSKDEILISAWSAGPLGKTIAVVGLATAFLTAFYSFRLVFVAFWGPSRLDPKQSRHIHEPSATMTVPLIVLAVLSIATGYLGIPGFLTPVLPGPPGLTPAHEGVAAWGIMGIATLMGLGGIALAYVFYVLKPVLPDRLAQQWNSLYAGSLNKWYVDELYDAAFVRPTVEAANDLWRWFDVRVIDGAVNGFAEAVALWSRTLRVIQTGEVQHYALAMALGAVVILGVYLLLCSTAQPDILLNNTVIPHLLTLLIFLPLMGVIVMAFFKDETTIKHLAFWTASLEFLLSLLLYWWFDPTTSRMQFGEVIQWITNPSIRYALGIDGISLWLILLTTLLMPICVIASWTAIRTRVRAFMSALLVMETAMVGVFCALDVVLFYVFWEMMLIPMYLIIGVWGGPNRIYAAIKFFLYTLAGSVLLLIAIIVLYMQGGHTFDMLALSRVQYDPTLQAWLFWAFFAAFAVKVPMLPFHTWLPDAHVEAPTAGSVLTWPACC